MHDLGLCSAVRMLERNGRHQLPSRSLTAVCTDHARVPILLRLSVSPDRQTWECRGMSSISSLAPSCTMLCTPSEAAYISIHSDGMQCSHHILTVTA